MSDKLYTQIDNELIELTGSALDELLALRASIDAEIEAQQKAELERKQKRLATLAKLKALGLDEDDLKALGL